MERSNQQWIALLRSVDPTALEELRAALRRNLAAAFAGRGCDDSFLDDATQESLLRTLDKLDQFQGRSRFVTWATAIAVREAMNRLRRDRWRHVSLEQITADHAEAMRAHPSRELSPADNADRRDLLAALRRAISESLTPRQRQALVAELRGMPLEQIAARLGSNRNAVYKLTHDARRKLRERLEADGYTAADLIPPDAYT